MRLQRAQIFPEAELPDAAEILSTGRRQAPNWPVVQGSFLRQHQCACEADYKRHQMRRGRVMQHAHMGFRDRDKSIRAFAQIYEETAKHGVMVDRIGVCLDWSMEFPRAIRNQPGAVIRRQTGGQPTAVYRPDRPLRIAAHRRPAAGRT